MNDDDNINDLLARKYPKIFKDCGMPFELIEKDHSVPVVKEAKDAFFARLLSKDGSPLSPIIYFFTERKFYKYNPDKGIYLSCSDAKVIDDLRRIILSLAEQYGAIVYIPFRLFNHNRLSAIMQCAKGVLEVDDSFFAVDNSQFICFSNGMYNIYTKSLSSFDESRHMRNCIPFEYDPNAPPPKKLLDMLRSALDVDMIDIIQQYSGQTLLGYNKSQSILILKGRAGTGKGTLVNVIKGTIGESNVGELRMKALDGNFEMSSFYAKTLLLGADVNANYLDNDSANNLKKLTGEDTLSLEFKNTNERKDISGHFNIIIVSNNDLTIKCDSDTDAWRRRLKVVYYEKESKYVRNSDLAKELIGTEATSIIKWALEGLDKIIKNNSTIELNERQIECVDDVLIRSKSPRLFIQKRTREERGLEVSKEQIYQKYVNYCKGIGWKPRVYSVAMKEMEQEIADRYGIAYSDESGHLFQSKSDTCSN